jgi:hypothetical protein
MGLSEIQIPSALPVNLKCCPMGSQPQLTGQDALQATAKPFGQTVGEAHSSNRHTVPAPPRGQSSTQLAPAAH